MEPLTLLFSLPAAGFDLCGENLEGAVGSSGGGCGDCLESAPAGLEEKQPGSSPQMPQHCGDAA